MATSASTGTSRDQHGHHRTATMLSLLVLKLLSPASPAVAADAVVVTTAALTAQQSVQGLQLLLDLSQLELERYGSLTLTGDESSGPLQLELALADSFATSTRCIGGSTLLPSKGLRPQEHAILRCAGTAGQAGTPGPHFALVGGDAQGVLYATYLFAEKHLGVSFSIGGDRLPALRRPVAAVVARADASGVAALLTVATPKFMLRGIQPFHDFREGPDWWSADDSEPSSPHPGLIAPASSFACMSMRASADLPGAHVARPVLVPR